MLFHRKLDKYFYKMRIISVGVNIIRKRNNSPKMFIKKVVNVNFNVTF